MNDNQTSEHHYRTLEAIHDGAVDSIITISESGLIQTANPATESLFGYDAVELIGKNINMLMPSPYREEHDGYLEKYRDTGVAKIIGIGREVVARRKNGTEFPVHLAVSEVRFGPERVFAGFVRDLSNLKLLEEQRAALGRIIEDSLNEVFIFDAHTLKFVQANRGGRENTGYTLDEIRELTPVDIKPEYTQERFEKEITRPLLNKEVEKKIFVTKHRRKDGTTYDVEVHLQLSTFQTKPVFVAIILDVTKRLEAERMIQDQQQKMQSELERLVETRTKELRLAQAELVRNEKFATLGKVSGGIAHEIRNPLNAVKTSAYFLLNAKNPTSEKVTEHLERIDRQVSMIENVITALSDVAKMPDAVLKHVDMRSVLQGVLKSVDLPNNIETVFAVPEPTPHVLADENQIVIAFRNLVRNARDAMSNGGVLTIKAEEQTDKVVFSIIDQGAGIPDHVRDKILEPLFTTKARGMGLGLTITLAIVEKNEGQLEFESEVGRGSRFDLTLKK